MLTTGLDRGSRDDTKEEEAIMLTTGMDIRNAEGAIGDEPAMLTTGLDRGSRENSTGEEAPMLTAGLDRRNADGTIGKK